jgi:hypothetical protein
MTVPVYVANGSNYELKRKSLQEMWNDYANEKMKKIKLQVRYRNVERKRVLKKESCLYT